VTVRVAKVQKVTAKVARAVAKAERVAAKVAEMIVMMRKAAVETRGGVFQEKEFALPGV
jgi:hypothetical protein